MLRRFNAKTQEFINYCEEVSAGESARGASPLAIPSISKKSCGTAEGRQKTGFAKGVRSRYGAELCILPILSSRFESVILPAWGAPARVGQADPVKILAGIVLEQGSARRRQSG